MIGFFFVRRQLSNPLPRLLPVDLLRIPIFSPIHRYINLFFLRSNVKPWYQFPFYFQRTLGLRCETETGLLLTPWPIATMILAPIAGRLIEKIHAGILGAHRNACICDWFIFSRYILPCITELPQCLYQNDDLLRAGFGLFQSPKQSHYYQFGSPQ